MFKKYFIIFSLAVALLFSGKYANAARDPRDITDWYIQNFDTNIVVNKDSSLLITENITADCGNLDNKHGIFRVLPTQIKTTDAGIFKTPISLVSITDFNGNAYKYETIKSGDTITWKIGDPDVTVTGVNYYRIVYKVKNAIRTGNKDFDELYWNLLGDYWDIGTDNFSAKISFPDGINSQNTKTYYYTGYLGSKDQSMAAYFWDNNVLNFVSTPDTTFQPGQGVTVSVVFSKNIFTPYVPTFMEQYGDYFGLLFLLIPICIFIYAFNRWRKYGRDPKMKKPIPPEFGIPGNITPVQMGMILSHGRLGNNFISASIIDLAVKKFITIQEIETKVIFLKVKDLQFTKNIENYNDSAELTKEEKFLIDRLFSINKTVKLSELRNNFVGASQLIGKLALEDVVTNGWIVKQGTTYGTVFISIGAAALFFSIWGIIFSGWLSLGIFLSGIIFIIFGSIMPKRTQAGVDMLFRIKGFELYMRQAENYRQQFYEKEDIFDKFLPYAIIFGIAELWAKKMQLIYGEDYFKNYHPAWFVGSSLTNFDINSFTSQLNSITTSISASTSGSSGSGGGGSSGGGGGGGGGGGW